MCWGLSASAGMAGLGAVAVAITMRRGRPSAVPLTLAYFSVMETLQAVGYLVVDQYGSPLNQKIALLSFLYIVFQPFLINAFAMALVPQPVKANVRGTVYAICAACAVVMLVQLYPFDWAGACRPGGALCGPSLCTVSGEWHIGWEVPYNGFMIPLERSVGMDAPFPTYALAAFIVPICYGAWRFSIFHALLGPGFAMLLTNDPREMPAIWCLFSVGIVLLSLNPWLWRRLQGGATALPR